MRGADGRLLKRITFLGLGELEASDVITSGYVQDHWQVNPRLALDLGVRYDHDAMLQESHLSPRTAFSLSLDADGRTLIKGGWGPSSIRCSSKSAPSVGFNGGLNRTSMGAPTLRLPAVVFENLVDPEGFEEPTSRVWNVEFDHQLSESLLLRVNYRENRASGRPIIDRVTDDDGSALLLSSTGTLLGREFDTTLRWTLATGGDWFFPFRRSAPRATSTTLAWCMTTSVILLCWPTSRRSSR